MNCIRGHRSLPSRKSAVNYSLRTVSGNGFRCGNAHRTQRVVCALTHCLHMFRAVSVISHTIHKRDFVSFLLALEKAVEKKTNRQKTIKKKKNFKMCRKILTKC